MAARKKAKSRKTVQRPGRAAGGARKASSGRQQIRARLQKKVDVRVKEVATLAQGLHGQGLSPDEIASRVRSELSGLGAHVTDDVLRLALNGTWIRTGGEA